MLSLRSIQTKFNVYNSIVENLKQSNSLNFLFKHYSNDSNDKKSKDLIEFKLTEDLPPIPENYGFVGDENVKTLFELKRINASFKYGNPPKLRRRIDKGPLVIRLFPISNCNNRKFYRFAVTRERSDLNDLFIEDLGSIDPMPNKDNQVLVALNFERIKYYLSKGCKLKGRSGEFLGLAGFLPVHPNSYLRAYKLQEKLKNDANTTVDTK